MTASVYNDPYPRHIVLRGRAWSWVAGVGLRFHRVIPLWFTRWAMRQTLKHWEKLAVIQRQLEGRQES
jgi:hypothetical protein